MVLEKNVPKVIISKIPEKHFAIGPLWSIVTKSQMFPYHLKKDFFNLVNFQLLTLLYPHAPQLMILENTVTFLMFI